MRLSLLPLAVVLLSFLFFVFALFLDRPSLFGVCFHHASSDRCIAPYGLLADAVLPLASALLIFSGIAFYLKRLTYIVWLIFTITYGILAAAIFIVDSVYGVGMYKLDVAATSVYLAILYAFLSTAVLVTTEYVARGSK